MTGLLFVVTAPSGAGKSTLIRAALDGDAPMQFLSDRFENLWILLWGIAAALMGRVARSTLRFSLLTVSGLVLLVGATLLAFINHWWLPVGPVAIAWVTSAGLVTAFLSGHERQEKKFLMDIFSKSVSPEVADEMWKQRASFLKGGRLEPVPVTGKNGYIELPAAPGLGVDVDEEALKKFPGKVYPTRKLRHPADEPGGI